MDKLALLTEPVVSGALLPEATSFDGVTDYLSRSSDLVGNVDSKTFTFSCWVYWSDALTDEYIYTNGDASTEVGLNIKLDNTKGIEITGYNSSVSTILYAVEDINGSKYINTFVNIKISVDLYSSGLRSVFVNDEPINMTWSTYVDDFLNFTTTKHSVGQLGNDSKRIKGRLSHLFLDYVYRDLSIEANRRLFITEDGKPAEGQYSLNPIIGMSMKSAAEAHINDFGTGGDFVQNGTLDTASRGPNQWNCVASEFDGVDDYLSSAGLIGSVVSKQLTLAINIEHKEANTVIAGIFSGSNIRIYLNTSASVLRIRASNSSNVSIFDATVSGALSFGKHYFIQISVDLENTGNRNIIVNGVPNSPTWNIYTNDSIEFTPSVSPLYILAANTSFTVDLIDIGEYYLDGNYIDLSTDNPFWDAEANRPKPVAQVINETGHTPLIAMPISADNPEKNLGTGGDFTLNGGGLVGSRGGSEFWARSAKFGSSSDYLVRTTSLVGSTDGKQLTMAFAIKADSLANDETFISFGASGATKGEVYWASGKLNIKYQNSIGTEVIRVYEDSTWVSGKYRVVLLSVDSSSTVSRYLSVGGSTVTTWGAYLTDGLFYLTVPEMKIGTNANANIALDGNVSGFYLSDQYIDFSNESNRNLFVDQMGYPKDLTPDIEEGTIPTPLIYLPFDEADNLGKNLGTGGDFTVNGTVTQGADFNV